MSLVFGLSLYTATGNSCTFGNESVLVGFLLGGRGGGDSDQKVDLRVIAVKIKICTYLDVRNIPYPQDVS